MNFFRINSRQLLKLMPLVLLTAGFAQAETTETKPSAKTTEENQSEPACIAIVGTNDLHGAVQPQALEVGDQKVLRGGILTISGYVDILRQEFGKRVILLDGGEHALDLRCRAQQPLMRRAQSEVILLQAPDPPGRPRRIEIKRTENGAKVLAFLRIVVVVMSVGHVEDIHI